MRARIWTCPSSGGPEHLSLVEETLPDLGPTDVLVRHEAIGINFMDVYFRSGVYANPAGRLGGEAAGVVARIGNAVADVRVGDRVAYASGPNGAYADMRVIDAAHLVKLPDGITFPVAAAALLKGMTAAMLVTRVLRVAPGEHVLVHAAAGGVGLFVGQWLRAIGAMAIGVVGDAHKKQQALHNGYAHVIDRQVDDVAARVMELTDGRGVSAVLDGVGQDTFETSLAALAIRGTLVSFGAASGPVSTFSIARLAPKALHVTRPTLTAYTATRAERAALAEDVLQRLQRGDVQVALKTYGFHELPAAHRELEQRRTTGSLVVAL